MTMMVRAISPDGHEVVFEGETVKWGAAMDIGPGWVAVYRGTVRVAVVPAGWMVMEAFAGRLVRDPEREDLDRLADLVEARPGGDRFRRAFNRLKRALAGWNGRRGCWGAGKEKRAASTKDGGKTGLRASASARQEDDPPSRKRCGETGEGLSPVKVEEDGRLTLLKDDDREDLGAKRIEM